MKKNKSIIPNDQLDRCYLCGKYGVIEEHHIFGGPVRTPSDKRGLVVHLCKGCHDCLHNDPNGYKLKDYLHRVGQRVYEDKIGSRQQFIDEFIRSYL